MESAILLALFAFTTLFTFSLDVWKKRRKNG
jgi:hypothetical protein